MPHKKGPHFNPEPVGMFVRLARRTEHILGEPLAFTVALLCVVLWLLMGPSIDRGHWQEPIWTVTIRRFCFGRPHDCSNSCLGSNSSNFSLKCSKRPRDKARTEVLTYSPRSRRVRPIMDRGFAARCVEMSILWGKNQPASPPHQASESRRARHN